MFLRTRFPQPLLRVLHLTIFAALLVLLWRSIDGWAALAHLQGADPRWLAAAALALTLQTLLSAARWRVTAARLGLAIAPLRTVREYYLAQVVNQSLPGGVLGDAGRAVRVRGEAGLMISGQAVLFERVAGQLGLLAILLAGLSVSALVDLGFSWPLWLTVPLTFTLLALIAAPVLGLLALRLFGPGNHALRRGLRAFHRAVLAREVVLQQAGLSLGTALCNIAAFAFCAVALGIGLPALVAATLVPLILFAMVLPFSVGGWGFREGAAALLFPIAGATASEGLATSIAFGLVFLATILPGVALSRMRPIAPVPAQQ